MEYHSICFGVVAHIKVNCNLSHFTCATATPKLVLRDAVIEAPQRQLQHPEILASVTSHVFFSAAY